jgi:hypothetical protein
MASEARRVHPFDVRVKYFVLLFNEIKVKVLTSLYMPLYRAIKRSLCTWWLHYRKLQVMFKMSLAILQTFIDTRLTLTPSVMPNSNYVSTLSDWDWNIFAYFLYSSNHVNRDFLITLYKVVGHSFCTGVVGGGKVITNSEWIKCRRMQSWPIWRSEGSWLECCRKICAETEMLNWYIRQ